MTPPTKQLSGTPETADLVGRVPESGGTYMRVSWGESSYQVRPEPGTLKLEKTDAGWALLDQATGIFGVGPEPSEAVTDLRNALREHLDVLEAQAELAPALAAQRDYLRARFSKQT